MSEKEIMINNFWKEFLLKTNRDKDTKYVDCFHFELTEKWANELLRLVLIGQKEQHLVVYLHIRLMEIEFHRLVILVS